MASRLGADSAWPCCRWCDGTGRAIVFGVAVACACRPFDVVDAGEPNDRAAPTAPRPSPDPPPVT